jgi:hypothetical protein
MRTRNTTASLERLIRRDFPEWHKEAAQVTEVKNTRLDAIDNQPWTTADVLLLALRLGLDELSQRYTTPKEA